jgi:hypothetical protein
MPNLLYWCSSSSHQVWGIFSLCNSHSMIILSYQVHRSCFDNTKVGHDRTLVDNHSSLLLVQNQVVCSCLGSGGTGDQVRWCPWWDLEMYYSTDQLLLCEGKGARQVQKYSQAFSHFNILYTEEKVLNGKSLNDLLVCSSCNRPAGFSLNPQSTKGLRITQPQPTAVKSQLITATPLEICNANCKLLIGSEIASWCKAVQIQKSK